MISRTKCCLLTAVRNLHLCTFIAGLWSITISEQPTKLYPNKFPVPQRLIAFHTHQHSFSSSSSSTISIPQPSHVHARSQPRLRYCDSDRLMPEPRASLSSIQTLSARGEDKSTHAHTSQLRDIVELSLLIPFEAILKRYVSYSTLT